MRATALPDHSLAALAKLRGGYHRVMRGCHFRFASKATEVHPPGCAINGPMHCRRLASLFDHVIGELLKLYRYIEAQRSGSLEVDPQFDLRGLFHRQVAGIGPL